MKQITVPNDQQLMPLRREERTRNNTAWLVHDVKSGTIVLAQKLQHMADFVNHHLAEASREMVTLQGLYEASGSHDNKLDGCHKMRYRITRCNGCRLKHLVIEACHELFEQSRTYWAEKQQKDTITWQRLNKSDSNDESVKKALQKIEKAMDWSKNQLKQIRSTKLFFGNTKTKSVFELIKNKLATVARELNLFDERREVFAFTNICFNLKTKEWFRPCKYDYILTTCGKEWRDPTLEEYETVRALMESMFFDKEKLKSVTTILHACLSGIRHEVFIFFTGGGRNGKGFLCELLIFLLAQYAMTGHQSVLTQPWKEGVNEELRSLHKRRAAIWDEADKNRQYKCDNIKRISGGEEHNARGGYQFGEHVRTKIFATLIAQCNAMPPLQGDKDHALVSRIVKLDFETTFCDASNPEQAEWLKTHNPEEKRYYMPMNKDLKLSDFKVNHYCAFFKYLTDHSPDLQLYLPKCTRDSSMAYIEGEDEFATWFQENYEKYETVDRDTRFKYFVPTKEVFVHYTENSTFWLNATKVERRLYNQKRFDDDMKANLLLKRHYRDQKKEKRIAWYSSDGWQRTENYNGSKGIIGWRPKFNHRGEQMDYSEEAERRNWAEAEVMEERERRATKPVTGRAVYGATVNTEATPLIAKGLTLGTRGLKECGCGTWTSCHRCEA